jgi:hypothetical protein
MIARSAPSYPSSADGPSPDDRHSKGVLGTHRFESVRGLRVSSCSASDSVRSAGVARRVRRPRSVHQRPPWPLSRAELVKQPDRMLASVAREVTVMAVDNPVLPGTGVLGSRRPNGRVRRVVGGRTDGLEV